MRSAKTAIRNEKIGFVFQFHYLLNEFTALENVMMPALINKNMNKNGIKKSKGAAGTCRTCKTDKT